MAGSHRPPPRGSRQEGPAGARNRGAEIATGEILYFVDADTGVHPTNIGAVIEAFDADPAADSSPSGSTPRRICRCSSPGC